jgi:DNA repair exonuclease SbcCD nuclease subunit
MNDYHLRLLLVADTHLGFDLPFRPRVERRRRGPDFFTNFDHALRPALEKEVDLVIHGGDLFYRSKVPDVLVEMALTPLVKVAERGVPVFIVPGNHERSRIPLHLWTAHPNIHIFDEPKTYLHPFPGGSLALAGFPFARRIRETFGELLERSGYQEVEADVHVLCLHQTVEGSQVGPSNYTFRQGPDIIPGVDIPGDFSVILSGHIHRSQMLTRDLAGKPLAAPVVYPGSIERTSFAEREEDKHYVIVDIYKDGGNNDPQIDVQFIPLPARPMIMIDLKVQGLMAESLTNKLRARLKSLDPEAVVRIRVRGQISEETGPILTAAFLRKLAPSTMNVSVSFPDEVVGARAI